MDSTSSSEEAEQFKLNLKDKLALARKNGWIEVMAYIHSELPFLLTVGKPSNEQIQNSIIGKLGYKSWKDFIHKELGWSSGKWISWRRAYARILINDYLIDISPSRSAINETYKHLKNDFPRSPEEWYAYQKLRAKKTTNSAEEIATNGDCFDESPAPSELMTWGQALSDLLSVMRKRLDQRYKKDNTESQEMYIQVSNELTANKEKLSQTENKNADLIEKLEDSETKKAGLNLRLKEEKTLKNASDHENKKINSELTATKASLVMSIVILILQTVFQGNNSTDINEIFSENNNNLTTEIERLDSPNDFPWIICE